MKNPTIDITVANRLLDCGIRRLSWEPMLGIIEMHTEQGFVPVAINRKVAIMLIDELIGFIGDREEDNEPEEAAND